MTYNDERHKASQGPVPLSGAIDVTVETLSNQTKNGMFHAWHSGSYFEETLSEFKKRAYGTKRFNNFTFCWVSCSNSCFVHQFSDEKRVLMAAAFTQLVPSCKDVDWIDVIVDFETILCPSHQTINSPEDLEEIFDSLVDSFSFVQENARFRVAMAVAEVLSMLNLDYDMSDAFLMFANKLQELFSVTMQMKPLSSLVKGAKNRGKSAKINTKEILPSPRKIRSPEKRDYVQCEERSKASARFLNVLRDDKTRRKLEFELQFAIPSLSSFTGTSELIEAINKLVATMEDGVTMKHSLTIDVTSLLMPTAACLAIALLWLKPPKSLLGQSAAVCGIILSVVAVTLGPNISNRVKEIFDSRNECQSMQVDVKTISSVIFGILTIGVFANSGWQGKFNSCFKHLNSQSRVLNSIQDIISFVIDLIDKIYVYVRTDVMGYDYDRLFTKCHKDVGKWIDEIESFSRMYKRGLMKVDFVNSEMLYSLELKGIALSKEYRLAGNDGRAHLDIIREGMAKIKELGAPFRKVAFTKNQIREKPFTVLLFGASGVGKSMVTIPLIDSVLCKVLSHTDLIRFCTNNMDFVYSRNYETKYWDGYNAQFVTVFDDFLQTYDGKENPDCEAMNIIRGSNAFPYLLHMANLEDKANTYFSSKIIVCTTNNKNLHSMVLREPEALKRRFDLYIGVYPKPEFCTNPDETILSNRRLKKMESFSTDIYEFHLMGGKDRDQTIDILTYDELVDRMVFLYQCEDKCNREYLESIKGRRIKQAYKAYKERFPDKEGDKKFKEMYKPYVEDYLEDNMPCGSGANKTQGCGATDETLYDRYLKMKIPEFMWHQGHRAPPGLSDGIVWYSDKLRQNSEDFYKGMWTNILKPVLITSVGMYGLYKLFSTETVKRSFKTVIENYCPKNENGEYMIPKKLLEYAMDHDFTDVDLQSVGLIGGKLQHARTIVKKENVLADLPLFQPQFRQICKTTEDVARKVLMSNWYCLLNETGTLIGCGLFVKGDVFLTNAHYYEYLSKWQATGTTYVLMCKPSDYFNGAWDETSFRILTENVVLQEPSEEEFKHDTWFFRIKGMRPHADIVKLFASENCYENTPNGFPAIAYFIREQESQNGLQPYLRMAVRGPPGKGMKTGTRAEWNDYVALPIKTEVGDCGSLVLMNEDWTAGGRIIGIHAGYNHQHNMAIAVVCTRERLQKFLDKKFPVNVVQSIGVPAESALLFSMQINGAAPHEYFNIGKSKLRKSPCYGAMGPGDKHVAILKPCAKGNPMEVALRKYARCNRQVSDILLTSSANHYELRIMRAPWKRGKNLLTFEEAILGIEGEPFMNSINRASSAGYPYNTYVTKSGKWDIFGDGQDFDLNTPLCKQLKEEVTAIIEQLKKGERPLFFFMDCLKDELRADSKIEKCSTRLFSGSPVAYVVVFLMFLGKFISFYLELRFSLGSAIGVNPFSTEWNVLAKQLLSKGRHIIAGDFAGFDATQYSMILQKFIDMINRWYGDSLENQRIRELIWHEVWNSHHINSGIWFEWDHSNPSGNPGTTPINTIYVNVVMRMAWVICFGGSVAVLVEFDKHVLLIANGDDHLMAVSDEAIGLFNYQTIQKALAQLGLEYTDEAKSLVLPISKQLHEVSFLKRGFKWNGRRFLAPLEWNTVRQMSYWYKHGPDVSTRIIECVENSLMESTLHGEDKFCEIYDICEPILRECGLILHARDYKYFADRLRLEWYDSTTSNAIPECELLVNVNSEICDVENADDPSCLTLLPGGSQKHQVTSCGSQDGCIEFQMNAPAENEHNNTGEGEKRNQVHSQGVLNAASTSDATMHFTHGRGTVEYEPFDVKQLTHSIMKQRETISQDIVTFLHKPLKIYTFSWATTALAGATLLNFRIPFDNTMDSNIALFKNKLWGFLGFKATAVLKIVLSVNKFAQGRLLCHYIPGTPNLVVNSNKMYLADLTTRTQQPRVDLDIGMQTEADIRIPFVSAELFYNLVTGANAWAQFYITVYSPLVGPGATVTGSVFLHFEDVEFSIPTSIVPQMGDGKRRANRSEKETASGPLSRRFDTLTEAFNVASQVPELSSVAGTASWVSELLAKTARAFGYSKPSETAPPNVITNLQQQNCLNFDGINAHVPLGLSARNKVDVLPGFAGNDVDELSIRYITQRAAFFQAASWTTSNAVDTVVMNGSVNPNNYLTSYSGGGQSWYTATPLTWTALNFGLWRGDIVFHFKFVRTQFHTGKLMFTLEPNPTGPPTTTATAAYVHTEVIDISEKSEFHVRVPFMALSPWLDKGTSAGRWNLIVLTPLNAPSSVSNGISVLLEVSGGDNMEFATLRDVSLVPLFLTEFIPQIQDIDDMSGENSIVPVGNANIQRDIVTAEQYCIGEKITSMKQLLLRHNRVFLGTTGNIKSLQVGPFKSSGNVLTVSTSTLVSNPMSRDLYSCLSAGYVLLRGGVSLILQNTGDNVSTSTKSMRASMAYSSNAQTAIMFTSNSLCWDYNTGTYITNAYVNPALAVTVPAWGPSHSRYAVTDIDNNLRNWVPDEPRSVVAFVNPSTSATIPQIANTTLLRAVCDDAAFGYFIGFPPFQLLQEWNGSPNL